MDNPTMNLIKDEHADIPFVDVLVPYTQGFVNELKNKYFGCIDKQTSYRTFERNEQCGRSNVTG